tara:strand:+ start:378 stop:671 length:294 start_codon:yes stop_codon:yes gene_type:complete
MKNYIDDLNIPKEWTDTSWHNDAAYSFEVGDVRIWIDHKDAAMSEYGITKYTKKTPRFAVVCSDQYKKEHPNDHYIDDVLFTTNNFKNLLTYIMENK